MDKKKSGFGTAALVLSIIAICLCWIPIINNVSFILGILAVIFGIVCLIKKASKTKAIVSVIIAVITMFLTYNIQTATVKALDDVANDFSGSMDEITGAKTEEILAKHASVELGKFQVENNEYFDETKLVVKVTNKTTEQKSFTIQIEAVNADGSRIASDYVAASNLAAGQSQDFKCFTLVESEKIEQMKNATFRIVEVSMT